MSDDEIRIAIAEACGLPIDVCKCGSAKYHHVFDNHVFTPLLDENEIPNYSKDLNAMHEAEEVLDFDQQEVFLMNLGAYNHDSDATWDACHATARQRAEAFLRTINKWKD